VEKYLKYSDYLYIFAHVFIGLNIFNRTKSNVNSFLIFMGLFLLIIINNYSRAKHFYKDGDKYFLSMFVYMVLSGILIYNLGGNVTILYYMILSELIIFTEGKRSKVFILLSIISVLFLSIGRHISLREILKLDFWQENYIDVVMMVLYLAVYSLFLFTYKALRMEKRKVDNLNKELEVSNNILTEQSKKIEELTIVKERNRVAGELHDSLGHSLVALNMNLDVAGKIIDKDIDKAKELINKSKVITKESMINMRRIVYALKEEDHVLLIEKLKDMISNIENSGLVEIVLNADEKIESLSLEYKNIIYNSIKEAITNSIKHGKANRVNIDIKLDDNINISIKDNGLGCDKLVKGNGLLGIEKRINKINGKVKYDSMKNKGFNMEIEIWK